MVWGENDSSTETIKNGAVDSGVENYNTPTGSGLIASGETVGVNADNTNITLTENTLANITGNGDSVHLQANDGDTIGITGQNLSIDGDNGNNVINLNGDTSATISGGGYIGLCGDGTTVKTETDQNFTINTAPNVTNDSIYADGSTIDLTPGWSGNIYGEGLTINMSPDSGSDVMVYGYGDQVTGSQGDTLQADAYDPNDTSDPYAPYEPGDPEPGTPFDPEDPDPTDPDPTDPDDPYDDELVAVKPEKSTHTASSTSAAHDPAPTQPTTATTLASSAPPATASASHIATQASQLASAMAAFGGTTAGDSNLHAGTPAAHTTLAADPSQATHALRHAA